MMKLPVRPDGQWTVTHNSDKLPDLVATRNMTFDKEGYLRLSKPTVSFYSSADDADFGIPVRYQNVSDGMYFVATSDAVFRLDFTDYIDGGSFIDGSLFVDQDPNTNTPVNTDANDMPDAVYFNDDLIVINPTDRKLYLNSSGSLSSAWTVQDTSSIVSASTEDLHLCYFMNQQTLAVAEDDEVTQINTSYLEDSNSPLVLNKDFACTGIAYNNGYVGVTTQHVSNTERCQFIVWDGNTTEANYVVEVPSICSYSPVGYKGGFVFLDGNGILWYWSPNVLTMLAALPVYYTNASFSISRSGNNLNHSIYVEGEIIYINIRSFLQSGGNDNEYYLHNQPGGIWCYDPAVGLYHRHAPTATKATYDKIATTSVDTSTDQITVTAAPDTGTPVRYSDGNSTAIAGLTNRGLYYAIKVDATNIQLASTYQNALDGTEIDLTGTGNNNQMLQFYPKPDFGQSYIFGQQGTLYIENDRDDDDNFYFQDIFYGSKCVQKTHTGEVTTGGFTMVDSENRGYFVTSKFMSGQLQDDWKKVYLKHSELTKDLDKIVVKYRIDNDKPKTFCRNRNDADLKITWSDENTFTTTDTQWANVVAGDEVEIIQGAGSGYLAHVSSISEAGGTYTVNIDEDIKNIAASDTGRAIASGWTKLTTITKDTVRNNDGYSEIPVGIKSKQIQFKIELRGEDIEVEELLLANELSKPV